MNKQHRPVGFASGFWLAIALGQLVAFGQASPTPGPEHEEFKRREGEWIATIKSPDGDSKGTMTYRVECGGLWLVSDFHAEFGGQKFQGRGLDSYDPQKKRYVSVWVDSMIVRPIISEGQIDKEKKTLTMIGEGPGPDGQLAKYKMVTRQVDADHEIFKMYLISSDGKETEMFTVEYARKK